LLLLLLLRLRLLQMLLLLDAPTLPLYLGKEKYQKISKRKILGVEDLVKWDRSSCPSLPGTK
jgi:hypothetical protein